MVGDWKKLAFSTLDRVLFIGIGVLGTLGTTLISGAMKDPPPKLTATQVFTEYQGSGTGFGTYRIDINNIGKGVEEDVRAQISFPPYFKVSYYKAPNFKIFEPTAVEFKNNEFYLKLPRFPVGANAFVVFRIDDDKSRLCKTTVKVVGKSHEGTVSGIEGIDC